VGAQFKLFWELRPINSILLAEMASTACFVIVSKNDIPIYEAEVGSAPKVWFFQYIPCSN
jgi:hypothetical protein